MEEKELWRLIQEGLGYTDAETEEDRICEGIDPDQGTLDRVRCIDVGLECGGWGEILMEVSLPDTFSEERGVGSCWEPNSCPDVVTL